MGCFHILINLSQPTKLNPSLSLKRIPASVHKQHTQHLSLKTYNFIIKIAAAYFGNLRSRLFVSCQAACLLQTCGRTFFFTQYQSTFQSLPMTMYFSKQCKNTYNIIERTFQICQHSQNSSKANISVTASCLCTHLSYPYPWRRSLCFKH